MPQITFRARDAAGHEAATGINVSVQNQIYVGARLTASFFAANYGGTGSDAPLSGSTDPKGCLTLFEQHVGKPLSFVHWGGAGSAWPPTDFNATAAQRAWDHGCFSMYGLSLPKNGCDALLAKSATAVQYLSTLASQMKAWGKPLLFRPLWEMNGAWFPWGRQNYTPEQYKTMWNNLRDIFDAVGAVNVSWAWVPNAFSSTVPDPSPWYPNREDWVGVEAYVKSGYMTPEERFGPAYNLLTSLAPGKPIIIGEMGVVAEATAPGKARFFKDFLETWLPAHPQIRAFSYFNDDGDTPNVQVEEGDGIGVLNSNALAAWKAGVASSYYAGAVTQNFPASGKVPIP